MLGVERPTARPRSTRTSGGNPFYLEQLARASGQTAAPRPPGGRGADLQVPPMVARR